MVQNVPIAGRSTGDVARRTGKSHREIQARINRGTRARSVAGALDVVILDSVGALVPRVELEGEMRGHLATENPLQHGVGLGAAVRGAAVRQSVGAVAG